jgi:hypothetical protein
VKHGHDTKHRHNQTRRQTSQQKTASIEYYSVCSVALIIMSKLRPLYELLYDVALNVLV